MAAGAAAAGRRPRPRLVFGSAAQRRPALLGRSGLDRASVARPAAATGRMRSLKCGGRDRRNSARQDAWRPSYRRERGLGTCGARVTGAWSRFAVPTPRAQTAARDGHRRCNALRGQTHARIPRLLSLRANPALASREHPPRGRSRSSKSWRADGDGNGLHERGPRCADPSGETFERERGSEQLRAPENRPESLTSFRAANRRRARQEETPCKCERYSESCSAPHRIRTCDLRFRRPMLYLAERASSGVYRHCSVSRIARATATGLGLVSVSPSSTSCVCSASSASSQLALLLIVVRSGRVRLGGTKRSNSRERGSTRPGALFAMRAARRGDTKRRLKPNTHAGFGTASWLGPSDPSSAARQIHVAWSIESELVDVGDAVERSDLSA